MKSPELDEMLSLEEAAEWLGMSKAKLMDKCRGCRPKIPGFRINQRVVRFHPRSIIAKMAQDAGMSPELIASSFGIQKTIIQK